LIGWITEESHITKYFHLLSGVASVCKERQKRADSKNSSKPVALKCQFIVAVSWATY
jgi:hypothetical protein